MRRNRPYVLGVYEDAAALAVSGQGHAFAIVIDVLTERVADARKARRDAYDALEKAERSRAKNRDDRIYGANHAVRVASSDCEKAEHALNVYKTAHFLSGMARNSEARDKYETFLTFLRSVDERWVEGMESHMERVAYNRAYRDIMAREAGDA